MRADMVAGLRGWAGVPAGRDLLERRIDHHGWSVEARRAPLGVVGFVFEGRPNVFADAAGVVRTGNTVVFRIGSDAAGHRPGDRRACTRSCARGGGAPARHGRARRLGGACGRLGDVLGLPAVARGRSRVGAGGGSSSGAVARSAGVRREPARHRRGVGGRRHRGRSGPVCPLGAAFARPQGVQHPQRVLRRS